MSAADRVLPLSAPDGTVYAYVCTTCRRVRVSGELLVARYEDEHVERMAQSSRHQAERCCTCRDCEIELPERALFDDPITLGDRPRNVCHDCWERTRPAREEWAREAQERDAQREAEVEASLAHALDRTYADQLREHMSELSEEHWCAGWLSGLGRQLWRALDPETRPERWGLAPLSDDDLATLRHLSESAGGWWYIPEGSQWPPEFVPLERWREIAATPAAPAGPKVYALEQ